MQIQDGIHNTIHQRIQRAQIETRYQTRKELDSIGHGSTGERVEISSGGRELARLQETLRQEADRLPEIRQERVAEVQARISSGYYSRPEVVGELAETLTASPMARVAAREVQVPGGPSPEGYRPELMREVGEKLRSGFYTEEEVMGYVADRLGSIYGIQ